MTKKNIHIFTSDLLPFPGSIRSAGGNRSMQILSALRNAGHRVTFSMPLTAYLANKQRDAVRARLTKEELWHCEHYFEPETVLNRIQPDIAIYCNVNCFRTVSRYARDVIQIVDLNGPMQFEGLLVNALDVQAALGDGRLLEARCRDLVDRFREIDYLVTVSERQRYFWLAYCSLAGFSFRELDLLVCPFSFSVASLEQKPSPQISVVHAGGFYPWQNPERFLRAAAEILDEMDGATLHIFGGPHAGLPNEREVQRLIEELRRHRCVEYHGFCPIEELQEVLSTCWAALDLMDRNIERELAINGRTLQFLMSGIPVIYNDYATLSHLIEKYNAGWTLPASDVSALGPVLKSLAGGGRQLVETLGQNARQLASAELNAEDCMSPLVKLCDADIRKRSRVPHVSGKLAATPLGRVLAISPDPNAFAELRINNPLRALHQQKIIEGFWSSDLAFARLKYDDSCYEAAIIQRAVPESVYLAFRDLGLPFILDVDDNLLARASYRKEPPETSLFAGLQHASVLTVPNPRLARLLEKYSGLPLARKAFITPNGLPFSMHADCNTASQPTQMIWIQSDIAALGESRDAVLRAVEDFSCKYELPLLLVGKNVVERPQFKHQVVLGQIDFAANLELLRTARTSIGVAPLETTGDPETIDFVNGKSDLKLVLFAGYGHPGVYSAAAPYTDSSLQECGSLIGNSYSEWMEALDYQFREGWKTMDAHRRRIQEERDVNRLAHESWAPALRACLFPKPVRGSEIYRAFAGFRNPDVDAAPAPRNEALHNLQKEIADLRGSLSWKITAPLRKLAQPLMGGQPKQS